MMAKNVTLDGAGMVTGLATAGIMLWAIVDLGMLRGEAGSNGFGPDPLAKGPPPPLL
jgi:uncharacterized membrane protein YhaH (DUF805 family)